MIIKCRRCGKEIPSDSLSKDILCISHYNIDEYAFFCEDCSPIIAKAIDSAITQKKEVKEDLCKRCKHFRQCDFSDDVLCHLDTYGHDLCLDNNYERFEARTCLDCDNFVSYGSDSLCNALKLEINDVTKPKCDVARGWRRRRKMCDIYNNFDSMKG